MTQAEMIDAYVLDVMAHLPRKVRHDIGFELRSALNDLVTERAEGRAADEALVLSVLTDFGAPETVAERYHKRTLVIIPAQQTRSFVIYAAAGVLLQWALSLTRLANGASLADWWINSVLAALWWPGFMVIAALGASWLKESGLYAPQWRPRRTDPDRVNRPVLAIGLAFSVLGAMAMTSFPAFSGQLPGVLADVFAFDETFVRQRAPLAPVLWLAGFAVDWAIFQAGRYSKRTRRLEFALQFAWIALLVWWIFGGTIFEAPATDEATKFWLGMVIAFILGAMATQAFYRRRQIRVPMVVA